MVVHESTSDDGWLKILIQVLCILHSPYSLKRSTCHNEVAGFPFGSQVHPKESHLLLCPFLM